MRIDARPEEITELVEYIKQSQQALETEKIIEGINEITAETGTCPLVI